ncbi:TRAP transporter large permease [Marasmitruncus massiliensis]|uniref:TRAP transporter large permease n=1 Tax=Marasmitruncus massiliensis TaxID=1944642 RepID=UPI000C7E835E|nr:TRAP transporter large permease [Marasmitruncus massiliensis]
MAILLFVVFFLLLAIGTPIAVCLGLAAMATLALGSAVPIFATAQTMFSGVDSFPLMAIPFFVLAGNIMASGGISKRLVNFANILVGKFTGGLAFVAVFASMIFAAISGSSPATTAAIGSVMMPEMKKSGYDEYFAGATVAAAGTVGQVIPPSVPMVVFSVLAGTSLSKMFLAGIVPGILMGLFMMVVAYCYAKKNGIKSEVEKKSVKEVLKTFADSLWAILMPVIILGGIYLGVFTPTEAAAVAVIYGVIVGLFVYKEIKVSDLTGILCDSAAGTAVIMLIMAAASTFGWVLTRERIPQAIATTLLSITDNKYLLLLLFNVILLIAGCFLNPSAAIVLLTPILLPVLTSVGVNPLLIGIVMVVNLAIGQITPPVGSCLYVACNIGNLKIERLTKVITPYLVALILCILLITYVEPVSLFLANFG